jgi:sigma54-dependent transcription regulator
VDSSILTRGIQGVNPRALIWVQFRKTYLSVNFDQSKGVFIDAKEVRIGRMDTAESGTLFLAVVGNTPPSQQTKLL